MLLKAVSYTYSSYAPAIVSETFDRCWPSCIRTSSSLVICPFHWRLYTRSGSTTSLESLGLIRLRWVAWTKSSCDLSWGVLGTSCRWATSRSYYVFSASMVDRFCQSLVCYSAVGFRLRKIQWEATRKHMAPSVTRCNGLVKWCRTVAPRLS